MSDTALLKMGKKLRLWGTLVVLGTIASAPLQAKYLLGPGDVLEVMVWKYEDLSRVIAVDSDGTVTVPLAGSVSAEGKTTSQVREAITQKLSKHITNPQVTIIVKEYVNNLVSVLGMVNKPGQYPIHGEANRLLHMLAMAGGTRPNARTRAVRILRHGRELRVNVEKLLKDPALDYVLLRPGDVVFVPKKPFVYPSIWQVVTGGASVAFIWRTFALRK